MRDWPLSDVPPLVGIMRGLTLEQALRGTEAVGRGGVRLVEVTMNSPTALETISALRESMQGEVEVGAGTVCTPAELEQALEAGARFIVTPVVVPEIIQKCVELAIPVAPGAFTPTEIYKAWTLGGLGREGFPAEVLVTAFMRAVQSPAAGGAADATASHRGDAGRLPPAGATAFGGQPAVRLRTSSGRRTGREPGGHGGAFVAAYRQAKS